MPCVDSEISRIVAIRAIESGLLRRQWLAAATRFEIALKRHDRALELAYKYGYNPDQPRVPAGSSDGGQGTSGAGKVGAPDKVRLAGDIPGGDPPPETRRAPGFTSTKRKLMRILIRPEALKSCKMRQSIRKRI